MSDEDEAKAEQEIHILGLKERTKTEFVDAAAIQISAAALIHGGGINCGKILNTAEELWDERVKRTMKRDGEITAKVRAIQAKYGINTGGEKKPCDPRDCDPDCPGEEGERHEQVH